MPTNLTFRQADATALPFVDDSFDVVIISNALHIIPQPERALAGVVFEVTWDEKGYLVFLEKNGWQIRESAVLKATFPLMYTECEDAKRN